LREAEVNLNLVPPEREREKEKRNSYSNPRTNTQYMVCHSALPISFGTLVRDSALHYELYISICIAAAAGGA
jgi:hypothetical protein